MKKYVRVAVWSMVIWLILSVVTLRCLGIRFYRVESGSMEPEILTGSMAIVASVRGEFLEAGDVAVYRDGDGACVVHRVLENNRNQKFLIFKGDANLYPDFVPVGYDQVLGREITSVPYLGAASGAVLSGACLAAAACLGLAVFVIRNAFRYWFGAPDNGPD